MNAVAIYVPDYQDTSPAEPIDSRFVWHYTSLESAAAIIRSGGFRPSRLGVGNDPGEYQFGRQLVQELKSHPKVDQKLSSQQVERFDRRVSEAMADGRAQIGFLSASTEGDALSLWRGYGNGEVALQIPTKSTLEVVDGARSENYEAKWFEVLYDGSRAQALVLSTLIWFARNLDVPGAEPSLNSRLRKCIMLVKDSRYIDEREVRIVLDGLPDRNVLLEPTEVLAVDSLSLPPKDVIRGARGGPPVRGRDKSRVSSEEIKRQLEAWMVVSRFTEARIYQSDLPFLR